jgi:hypothetical protein
LRAAEQDDAAIAQARQEWRTELEAILPERLVFLDESAVLTNMVRTHARSLQGTRAYGAIPCSRWTRLTVLGALGMEGILAAMSIEAATDADVLLLRIPCGHCAFLAQVLLPALRQHKPDAVLVMDNLSAHKAKAVQELLDRSTFRYRYLPSYSPDLCPSGDAQRQPDRAGVGENEEPAARNRRPNRRRLARGPRAGARCHHASGRTRLLPPCRLCPSKLTRDAL